MLNIQTIAITLENGTTYRWNGRGSATVAQTQTPVEGEPQAKWPYLRYITATLVIREDEANA